MEAKYSKIRKTGLKRKTKMYSSLVLSTTACRTWFRYLSKRFADMQSIHIQGIYTQSIKTQKKFQCWLPWYQPISIGTQEQTDLTVCSSLIFSFSQSYLAQVCSNKNIKRLTTTPFVKECSFYKEYNYHLIASTQTVE